MVVAPATPTKTCRELALGNRQNDPPSPSQPASAPIPNERIREENDPALRTGLGVILVPVSIARVALYSFSSLALPFGSSAKCAQNAPR